jgi:hypothetical protein
MTTIKENNIAASKIFASIWDAAADTITDPGRRSELRSKNPYISYAIESEGPMEYIIKPVSDVDFYLVWSTNTDSITSYGTEAELGASPELIYRADDRGSSMYSSSFDFSRSSIHFSNMGPTPFSVLRKDLREFCLSMNPRNLNVFDRSLTIEAD